MRKKTKGRRLPAKSSQGQAELADHNAESIDESSNEVQLQTGKSSEEEYIIKDDNECVIAVIDKSPAQSKSNEGNNAEADYQDDDVPEDVSWKASKESAIRERTLEKEIALDAKRKEKQIRIERNERLREQKERKREREYSKLPLEVLQQVAEQQVAEQQESHISQSDDTGNHVTFDSSSEGEDEDEDEEQPEENEATPEIKVLVLPRETKKPKKIQQSASLFLREHMFGDRIQRISQVKDSDRKRKYQTLGPALKFSKKSG